MSETENGPERPRRYVVVETERAEADRGAAFLKLNRFSPKYAGAWLDALVDAIARLPDWPGPSSHAIDAEASARHGYEVRRMLYHGPTRSRSGTPYRVLFTTMPPAEGETEGVIRVLRILHGAQQPFEQTEEAEEP